MLNISVNTTCMYRGISLDEAFLHMKMHGYSVFEQWMIAPEMVESIRDCMGRHGMSLSAFCPGYFTLNEEACHDKYEAALKDALKTAKRLACRSLITQVGQDTGEPRQKQHDAIVKGLMRMRPLLQASDVCLLIEPLNDVKDHKGYYLTSSEEGFAIIREAASPNIRLLYDVYHQLWMGEDVLKQVERNLGLIGHFHVAGYPGRDGNLFDNFDYSTLFQLLNHHGACAPVGLELFSSSISQAGNLLEKISSYRNMASI